ncbi:type IV secretion system protein [Xanthomonas campestris]|uniref:type IV secretion system protein n=5 Tax=Xanthomonas campestris TaxID=339 RepID=UPI000C1F4681|nr:type IV secretion system protein [Xanthomonas campestris]MCD0275554.1 type IV secretion system protein [Xanthomonas campestris pv. campestris]MCF8789502.1 type IV secretion system protein [Xanthomonas campestris pv. campestris]MCF8801987.1 type IV secretion system protein [Xanthomonas campestris pv. campestris]MCF8805237.1 type IV secretion system protein [Xanthomonas campestris pv. campestris]MCF8819635.1 type IV secretion system protein [Xanthomonas campestris]
MDFLSSLGNYAFFSLINDFLRDEIDIFQWTLLQRTSALIGIVSLTVLTLWVMFQGYRIVTGQSREAAMGLVVTALRAALIIGLATSMAEGSSKLYWTLTDGVSQSITQVVTGDSESPYDAIDKNLGLMQIAMMSIDQIQTAGNQQRDDEKTRARWFTGVGMAGPGVVGGSLLLLNKIGMALFVGFGPLFIMCLLFQATKSLFSKWLLYGLGMVFSLSVLSFTVSLATKVIGAVAVAFLVKYAMPGNSGEGISSMALQQGGLGLVMTTLIVTAPPMAAAFFQGTLGQFTAYSALGQLDRANQEPGTGRPYQPSEPARDNQRSEITPVPQVSGRVSGDESNSSQTASGKMGNANNIDRQRG